MRQEFLKGMIFIGTLYFVLAMMTVIASFL